MSECWRIKDSSCFLLLRSSSIRNKVRCGPWPKCKSSHLGIPSLRCRAPCHEVCNYGITVTGVEDENVAEWPRIFVIIRERVCKVIDSLRKNKRITVAKVSLDLKQVVSWYSTWSIHMLDAVGAHVSPLVPLKF